jgi:hypothetical protein
MTRKPDRNFAVAPSVRELEQMIAEETGLAAPTGCTFTLERMESTDIPCDDSGEAELHEREEAVRPAILALMIALPCHAQSCYQVSEGGVILLRTTANSDDVRSYSDQRCIVSVTQPPAPRLLPWYNGPMLPILVVVGFYSLLAIVVEGGKLLRGER